MKFLAILLFALYALPCYAQVATPVSPRASAPTLATMQNAATADGNGTILNVNGQATATLTVNCLSCSGGTQINFEASGDGTNYSSILATQLGTTTIASSTTTTGVTIWEISVGAVQAIRARVSNYSAGTITVTGRTHANSSAQKVVNVVGSVTATVSGVATSSNQSTQTGILTAIRDTAQSTVFVDDGSFVPGLNSLTMAGAEFNDSTPDSVDEGDAGALRMSANRNLYTQIRDAGGNERGAQVTAANALKVDNSGVIQPVSGTVTANAGTGTFITDPSDRDARVLGRAKITDGTDTAAVSGTGSLQVTCDNCGGSTFADNAAFTFGTTPISNMGAVVDDTSPNAVTENSAGAPRMSTNRNLYTTIRDAAGNERGVNVTAGNSLQVDGSGSTQPVSAASLPLPTGAATSAKQPALGTAGSPSSDVITVQGITSMTAIKTDGSAVTQPVSGTVNIGTFPDNEPINVAQINGVTPLMGNGTTGTGSQRVTIASDNTAFSVNATSSQSTAANLKSQVQGEAAHDATVAGNPLAVGGRSNNAVPTDVSADGEAVWAWLLRSGAVMTAQAPHLGMVGNPYTLTNKTVQTTTTQTGSVIWTPASGKKLVITSIQIQAGGTTAGTVQVWFEGSNGDTTYTRGTDPAIFDGEFAPSSTSKPGFVQTGLWIAGGADFDLRLTTSAAINPLTIVVWGYEQ